MKLLWTVKARTDLLAQLRFIAQDNPDAADKMNQLFLAKASALEHFPQMGRDGRVAGTRELLLPPHYVLVYKVSGETVYIVAVLHTSRQYPPEGIS